MSESDSFIEEVSEEVRRDQMYRLWRKYGPWLLGVIFLGIFAVAASTWYDSRQLQGARHAGGAYLEAVRGAEPEDAAAALVALADEAGPGLATLARLRAGAAFIDADEPDAAVDQYQAVLDDPEAPDRYRQLAELRLIMLRADIVETGAEIDALLERLQPLTGALAPWRHAATEIEAALKLQKGDPEGARLSLQTLRDDEAASASMKARAADLLEALGGA